MGSWTLRMRRACEPFSIYSTMYHVPWPYIVLYICDGEALLWPPMSLVYCSTWAMYMDMDMHACMH